VATDIIERGFAVRRAHGVVDVSSPQPIAERFAVLGAALYAVAIVVEAVRSRAWLAAALFVVVAAAAVWLASARVRYRLDRVALEVRSHYGSRERVVRLATTDVVDFVAASDYVRVITRDGRSVDLPRGTMRSHDEARALALFLRGQLGELREQEAGYRSF
jgi:DNA-binding LytR/AlgR family response regulator